MFISRNKILTFQARKVLSHITTRWRDFETFPTWEYAFENKKDDTPCIKYTK